MLTQSLCVSFSGRCQLNDTVLIAVFRTGFYLLPDEVTNCFLLVARHFPKIQSWQQRRFLLSAWLLYVKGRKCLGRREAMGHWSRGWEMFIPQAVPAEQEGFSHSKLQTASFVTSSVALSGCQGASSPLATAQPSCFTQAPQPESDFSIMPDFCAEAKYQNKFAVLCCKYSLMMWAWDTSRELTSPHPSKAVAPHHSRGGCQETSQHFPTHSFHGLFMWGPSVYSPESLCKLTLTLDPLWYRQPITLTGLGVKAVGTFARWTRWYPMSHLL